MTAFYNLLPNSKLNFLHERESNRRNSNKIFRILGKHDFYRAFPKMKQENRNQTLIEF